MKTLALILMTLVLAPACTCFGGGGCCQGPPPSPPPGTSAPTSPPTGTQPTAVAYTCPMHPDVVTSSPGSCPKCGMQLVPKQ